MEGNDALATPAHRIVDLGIAHAGKSPAVSGLTVDDNLKMGAYMPGARQICRAAEFGSTCSAHEGTAQPDGRHHVGRRTVMRDRSRADVESKTPCSTSSAGLARSGCSRCSNCQTHRARPDGADRRTERSRC
jgi:hypothetical protein